MDAAAYEEHHSFVWEFGRGLVALLDPQPGERILDLGCGGGQLTATIAATGADVTGVDLDPALIELAKARFPGPRWVEADIRGLDLGEVFDAVVSNAVLHWVPGGGVDTVVRHLRSGGRFVAEFGGAGNCAALLSAIAAVRPDARHPWYFPDEEAYTAALTEAGLVPVSVVRFERPTRLEAGPAAWIRAFGSWATAGVPDVDRFLADVADAARPAMWRDGGWVADYVRIRVVATKP